MQSDHSKEAVRFGSYLVGSKPDDLSIRLYEHAMQKQSIALDEKDQRILRFVMRNRWALGLVDAGLSMFRENSGVRKKIFVMLAILESSPLYNDQFLPKKRSFFYLFIIGWVGARAVFKAFTGGLLLKFI